MDGCIHKNKIGYIVRLVGWLIVNLFVDLFVCKVACRLKEFRKSMKVVFISVYFEFFSG